VWFDSAVIRVISGFAVVVGLFGDITRMARS